MTPPTEPADPAAVFHALGDGTRWEVLRQLGEDGAASASSLAEAVPISRQAVAKHLGVLERAGLVTRVRRGRAVLFTAEPAAIGSAAAHLQAVATGWERRLDAIKGLAETDVNLGGQHRDRAGRAAPGRDPQPRSSREAGRD